MPRRIRLMISRLGVKGIVSILKIKIMQKGLQKTEAEPVLEVVAAVVGGDAHQVEEDGEEVDDGRQLHRLRVLRRGQRPEEGEEEKGIVEEEDGGHPVGGDQRPAKREEKLRKLVAPEK